MGIRVEVFTWIAPAIVSAYSKYRGCQSLLSSLFCPIILLVGTVRLQEEITAAHIISGVIGSQQEVLARARG
jgi:hypothetical protein